MSGDFEKQEAVEAIISPDGHTETHRSASLRICINENTKKHNLELAKMMAAIDEEEQDDCPLCVCPMQASDVQFKMHCPTAHCDFNMCADCIQGMQKSESDGFQEASDGSRQVKFHITCPSCRSKYIAPDAATGYYPLLVEKKVDPHKRQNHGRDHHPIVGYVLLLREAYDASKLLTLDDSELSASELKTKHNFIQQTTLNDLKEAEINYDNYLQAIGKDKDLFHLDWDDFAVLPRSMEGSSLARRQSQTHRPPAWRDPTLFMGLEELMSYHEQEYVTQLMCSNDTNGLAQAAHIMHGVLNAMGTERASAMAVEELSMFGTTIPPPQPSPRASKPPPPLNPKEAQRLRGRFPLANHMPRCVVIPVFDPNSRNVPLKFETESAKNPSPLTLAQVRGIAGRSGLRRGDVVTHIHAEPVNSYGQFVQSVGHAYKENPDKGELMVVVNAHTENAKLLHQRAQDMQNANIKFG